MDAGLVKIISIDARLVRLVVTGYFGDNCPTNWLVPVSPGNTY